MQFSAFRTVRLRAAIKKPGILGLVVVHHLPRKIRHVPWFVDLRAMCQFDSCMPPLTECRFSADGGPFVLSFSPQ